MLGERQSGDDIFSTGTVVASLLLHVAVFGLIACVAGIATRSPKEEDIQIMDLTVVLHENLDKPPDDLKPDDKPKPKPPDPPKPKPKPPKPPEPPKQDPKVDAVEKVVEKPKKPEKKPFKRGERVENKTPPKQPAPPKQPDFKRGQRVTGNGPRTEKKLSAAEIRRMLAMGAKEGTRNQMPDNELSLCYSLIKRKFYDVWDQPAWSPNLKRAVLNVQFGSGGRVTGYKLVESSGDPQVDNSIRAAAARVSYVPGLTADFLRTHSVVPIAFEVAAE